MFDILSSWIYYMGNYKRIILVLSLILSTTITYGQKVYLVKYSHEVGNGRIYYTKYSHQADFKIYFVDYKHQADRVWNYVGYRHQTKMTETPE